MVNLPATFSRTGGSKAVGCLVYIVATPFLALCLAIFAIMPIHFALQTSGFREETVGTVNLFVFAIVGLGSVLWAFRDYRRRADFKVIIRRDRVVVQSGSKEDELAYAEVKSIRLVPAGLDLACVLVRQRGKPLRLAPEVAPFRLVRDALDEALVAELVQRLERRLSAGEPVEIRESLPRSLLAIASGLIRCLISVFMIVNPLRLLLGLALFQRGILVIKQGWLGTRGGFILDSRGLCPRSEGDFGPITWDRLERIRVDEVGLVLRSRCGRTLCVSSLAEDFWPALRWINARLSRVT